MKAFFSVFGLNTGKKAFIKPFEVPQGSAKIKILILFFLIQLSEIHGAGRVNVSVELSIQNYHSLVIWLSSCASGKRILENSDLCEVWKCFFRKKELVWKNFYYFKKKFNFVWSVVITKQLYGIICFSSRVFLMETYLSRKMLHKMIVEIILLQFYAVGTFLLSVVSDNSCLNLSFPLPLNKKFGECTWMEKIPKNY